MKAYSLTIENRNVHMFDIRVADTVLYIGRNDDEIIVAQNNDGKLDIKHFELGDEKAIARTFAIRDLDDRAYVGALLVLLADERICDNVIAITSIFNA